MTRRGFLRGLAGLVLAGLFVGLYAFLIEPSLRLRVRRWQVRSPKWRDRAPLKIAVVTDVHVSEPLMPLRRLRQVVRRTNGLGADLICYLGDLGASHPFKTGEVDRRAALEELAKLSAPLGVYSVLGNHDWWEDPVAQSRRSGPCEIGRLSGEVGLPVFENEAVRIETPEGGFWLAGLGDQLAFTIDGRRFDGRDDMAATLNAITDEAPAILMAHEPDVFASISDRFALVLSGHTHGGQVRLFGWSPKVPSKFGNRFAYGHVHEKGNDLVVSGGVGCSILPVRFGVTPEITVVELSA